MTIARVAVYGVALALVTFLIWRWNRGAQRRRFIRAFPAGRDAGWSEADAPFLAVFERAFALKAGWAARVPPSVSPMAVYLALYPEHCIYDDNELARLQRALAARLGKALPKDPLALPLGELAARWRAAPERNRHDEPRDPVPD